MSNEKPSVPNIPSPPPPRYINEDTSDKRPPDSKRKNKKGK